MKVTVLNVETGASASVDVETDEGHTIKLRVVSSYVLGDEIELSLDDELLHESTTRGVPA